MTTLHSLLCCKFVRVLKGIITRRRRRRRRRRS